MIRRRMPIVLPPFEDRLHQASPFESEVSAYPAIFCIGRQPTGPVMVARMFTPNIESERLVPLVMRDEIERGHIRDAGRFVINTFRDEGGPVDLHDYPKLARYLKTHAPAIRKRHVAKKAPANWFRTIDRVYPKLVGTPNLLIPDIAGANEVVFDNGCFHPHHDLYFVTSDHWDLEVLGGLLNSRVALFFVWSYAVKMRGG